MENKIINFVGKDGQMEKIIFENEERVNRKGGFVLPQLIQSSNFAKQLGCEYKTSAEFLQILMTGRTSMEYMQLVMPP